MATYFHGGPEVQQDGLQTLYLMNPSYAGLSENQSNLVFLNSNANSLSPNITNRQQNNHYVGIPIQSTNPSTSSPSSQDPNRQSVHVHLENPPLHGFMPRIQYNLWNPMDPSSGAVNIADMPVLRRSNQSPVATQQALSLTLSPQAGFTAMQAPTISPTSGDEIRISGSSSSTSGLTNGFSNLQSVLMGSKYLKASQELLDEVVNVGKEIKDESLKGLKGQLKINREMDSIDGNEGSDGGDSSTKQATELSTTEKQEIQMKKAKLINMLDEVEQRYKQYHHQMQIVVSSFETVAGFGSAKTYTALALQTISKQFRCLKDAISLQIRSANKSLGEEDCLGIKSESSRLRLVDHQLRQQRALQQLGMMQHNTWRPQRGLPERSVSVLRAWLFEHFLHPYPKDSDKLMLAKQTGLTRSQVSNWFINARVRLWKPMVEEMYLEETKEQERFGSSDKTENNEVNQESQSKFSTVKHNNNEIDPQNNQKIKQDSSASDVKETLHSIIHSSISPSTVNSLHNQTKFSSLMIGTTDTQTSFRDQETIIQGKFKRPCTEDQEPKSNERNNRDIGMTYDDENQSRDGYSLMGNNTNNGGGFGSYQFGEMGRFNPEHFAPRFTGNGVSLTLGLQHCENLSLSGSQQTYLTNQNLPLARRLEMGSEANDFCGINPQSSNHSANAFENINLQNRKRFAAQLLPDFVI